MKINWKIISLILGIIVLAGVAVYAYEQINTKINQLKENYYNSGFNEARKSILYDFRYKITNNEDIIVSIPDRDWFCDDIDMDGQWSLGECVPTNNTQFFPIKLIPQLYQNGLQN